MVMQCCGVVCGNQMVSCFHTAGLMTFTKSPPCEWRPMGLLAMGPGSDRGMNFIELPCCKKWYCKHRNTSHLHTSVYPFASFCDCPWGAVNFQQLGTEGKPERWEHQFLGLTATLLFSMLGPPASLCHAGSFQTSVGRHGPAKRTKLTRHI